MSGRLSAKKIFGGWGPYPSGKLGIWITQISSLEKTGRLAAMQSRKMDSEGKVQEKVKEGGDDHSGLRVEIPKIV